MGMDTTAQDQLTQAQPVQQSTPPVGAQEVPTSSPSGPQQGPTIQKEHELSVSTPQTPEKLIEPSEPVLEIHPEIQEVGVEAKHELPQLTLEDKNLGIAHSPESLPAPDNSIEESFPMSGQKATETLKLHKKVQNAAVWLAAIVVKKLKRMSEKVLK